MTRYGRMAVFFLGSVIIALLFQNCSGEGPAVSDGDLTSEESELTKSDGKKCGVDGMAKLREKAVSGNDRISIDCYATLDSKDIVTKSIYFVGAKASGAVLDCKGAKIQPFNTGNYAIVIQSRKITAADGSTAWDRPENITVRNCEIHGFVRIMGMGSNGEAEFVKESSRLDEHHTLRVQAAAPTKVTFDNVTIVGSGRIPFYIAPGVTHVILKNSVLRGKSDKTAVYLDTESAYNTISNNHFDVSTAREVLAVDGSAHNLISDNYFKNLGNGGIYLYRNCGEGGTIRHQGPQKNRIKGNTFYYKNYGGEKPSIWLASRNGNSKFCDADNGFPWGSSVDNNDFARENAVTGNLIHVLDVKKMIRVDDAPNDVSGNKVVKTSTPIPAPLVESFSCAIKSDNNGCKKAVNCTAGKKLKGLRIACNLEWGSISDSEMNTVPWNQIKVIKASDYVREGTCSVKISNQTYALGSGFKNITVPSASGITVFCKEKEGNGGDCEIRGEIKCE